MCVYCEVSAGASLHKAREFEKAHSQSVKNRERAQFTSGKMLASNGKEFWERAAYGNPRGLPIQEESREVKAGAGAVRTFSISHFSFVIRRFNFEVQLHSALLPERQGAK